MDNGPDRSLHSRERAPVAVTCVTPPASVHRWPLPSDGECAQRPLGCILHPNVPTICCMSTQIAVRLPDALVAELDAMVASGAAKSRASVIERALRKALRQYQYAQELALYDANPQALEDPDMDALAAWVAGRPMDLD